MVPYLGCRSFNAHHVVSTPLHQKIHALGMPSVELLQPWAGASGLDLPYDARTNFAVQRTSPAKLALSGSTKVGNLA
jgi:hypothetical protein